MHVSFAVNPLVCSLVDVHHSSFTAEEFDRNSCLTVPQIMDTYWARGCQKCTKLIISSFPHTFIFTIEVAGTGRPIPFFSTTTRYSTTRTCSVVTTMHARVLLFSSYPPISCCPFSFPSLSFQLLPLFLSYTPLVKFRSHVFPSFSSHVSGCFGRPAELPRSSGLGCSAAGASRLPKLLSVSVTRFNQMRASATSFCI